MPFALIAPKPRHAHCGAQFPGFRLLLASDYEGAVKILFCFFWIRRERLECDLASGPIEFRFVARFLGCFHRRQPLANTSARIGEWLRTEGRYLAS
jgi:hypothetical protein